MIPQRRWIEGKTVAAFEVIGRRRDGMGRRSLDVSILFEDGSRLCYMADETECVPTVEPFYIPRKRRRRGFFSFYQ